MAESLGEATLVLRTDRTQLDAGLAGAQRSVQKFGRTASSAGMALTAGLTLPIVGLGFVAAKASIDFESAFTGVRKTVDATEQEFAVLERGIRDMALGIPVAATEIARIGEAAGQLGIKTDNILGFSRVMADLGVTTNLASDEAATALARLANIMQTPQDQFENMGSAIVALGNNLATTEAEIVEMGLRLSGAGTIVGLTEAQVLSFAGALSSVGVEAQAGGTAVSTAFVEIAKSVSSGGEQLELFAAVAGQSVDDFARTFKEDAAGAMISFMEGLHAVDAAGGDVFAVLEALGLEERRMRDALLRAAGAGDLFRESLEIGSEAWEENTALAIEAELRYGTTASKIQILKNRLNEAAITLGAALAPALVDAMNALDPLIAGLESAAQWFADLPTPMQRVIIGVAAFAAVLGPALIIVGAMISGLGALVAIAPAVGAAVTVMFGPWGIALAAVIAAIAGVSAAVVLLTTDNENLGKTALSIKAKILELAEAFLVAADNALTFGGILKKIGFDPLSGAIDNVRGSLEDTNEALAASRAGWDSYEQALANLAQEEFVVQHALDTTGRLITTRDQQLVVGAKVLDDYARSLSDVTGEQVSATEAYESLTNAVQNQDHDVGLSREKWERITEQFDLSEEKSRELAEQILSTSDVMRIAEESGIDLANMLNPGLVNATHLASVKIHSMSGQIMGMAGAIVVAIGMMREFRASLGGGAGDPLGLGNLPFQGEGGLGGPEGLQELFTNLEELLRPPDTSSLDSDWEDFGAGLGDAAGAAAAENLVPAFVEEMQRRESIAAVIQRAVEAREVNWGDVAELYRLRAAHIAEDFIDELAGRQSEIGDAIADAAAAEAAKAGMEAAVAFVDAFEAGLSDLQSAIDRGFASIAPGDMSIEDAHLQLAILEAELKAMGDIAALEAKRQTHLDEIVRLRAQEEAQVAALNHWMEMATHNLRAQLEANDAMIEGLQDNIDARRDIIDGLRDELELKREALKADQEALRVYQDAAREHERVISDLERGLTSLRSEREEAWRILGMEPGGGPLELTLKEAAQNLKDAQDELAGLVESGGAFDTTSFDAWEEGTSAATDEFLALQDELAAAEQAFNELDQAMKDEIAAAEAELERERELLAIQEALIASVEVSIAQKESEIAAVEDAIAAQQDMIEAERDRIEALKEENEAIKDTIAEVEAYYQAQIDAVRESTEAQVEAQQEAADAYSATIKEIEDNIKKLRDEQRRRQLLRDIQKIQLGLMFDLYQSQEDLNWQMLREIVAAQELQEVHNRLEQGIYDVRDAAILLQHGLGDLAYALLVISANPALQGAIPSFHGGGVVPGSIGQPQLAVVHGGERITAPGASQPMVTINNTFHGTQNAREVERGVERGVNKALRSKGMAA